MIRWESLTEELAPWRALGQHSRSRTAVAALRRECLEEVEGIDPLAEPGARVLVAGDWHGDAAWARTAIAAAAEQDCRLLLQLGDFGFWNGDHAEVYLDVVEAACRSAGVTVCWLDGNHEDHDRLARFEVSEHGLRAVRPNVWHVPRGHRWQWGGRAWLAVGGAVSVDRAMRTPGRTWWAGEALTGEEVAAIVAAGPADVLLCHDRPTMAAALRGQTPGSWHAGAPPAWARADLVASDAHAALLQGVVDAIYPTRLLHGHLHERYDAVVDPTAWGGACHVTGLDQQGSADNLLLLDVLG